MTRHHPEHEVELYRDDDAYVVLVELPDYDPGDVTVHWRDGRLHVSAESDADGEGGRRRVYHRSLGVPTAIDDSSIEATYEDGVLEVTLPVRDGEGGGREISVRE